MHLTRFTPQAGIGREQFSESNRERLTAGARVKHIVSGSMKYVIAKIFVLRLKHNHELFPGKRL